jgi:DNA (cytosine-5)-methyltransferase 1
MMTLGSLFDGIGGFPLAALRNGIIPIWASEIEAFPIEVTKLRFPKMHHFGDITKLNGAELQPVGVITGGSPCQDLSVAGQRAGLAGERSGLFMEQIRIVKEMRRADEQTGRTAHAVRPRYMCWENVPGAFSSGTSYGEDFRAVLEETCRIADSELSIPRPPGRVWKSAGAILGDKFSVAWRVLDAQYWGVAQRRKRIFLVADFGGHTAPQILFEQDSLFGNITARPSQGQGTAAAVTVGIGDSSGDERIKSEEKNVIPFAVNQRDEVRDLGNYTGSLQAQPGMKQQTFIASPSVLCLNDQGGQWMSLSEDVCGTLRAQMDGHPPLVLDETAESYCIAGNIIDRETHNGGNGFGYQPDISYTLNTTDRHAVFSQQRCDEYMENSVVSTQAARQHKDATDLVYETYQQTVGSIGYSDHKGINNQFVNEDKCIVEKRNLIRRLTPLECERLQGFPDGWTDVARGSDSARYKALGNSVAIPCVEFVMRGIAYFLGNLNSERV